MTIALNTRKQVTRLPRLEYPMASESELSPALVAAHDPFGAYAEGLRTLRSQLLMYWIDKQDSTLAIVSARPAEGCSALAANLAIAFAQLGQRTLLVDGDLRQPAQQQLFGLRPNNGLADLLKGGCRIDEAVRMIPRFDSLNLLCAGSRAPNPQELLSRSPFTLLLQELRNRFDVVILDTPPLLQYADAQIIAAQARGCLIATRRHQSRLSEFARFRAQLAANITQIVGAVINV
jgi:protein-tyrosine kinase